MSIKNFKFVSPGVFINEIDESFVTETPPIIGPVIIGRAQKGLAMQPVVVNNYEEFVQQFGETVPGKGGGDVYRDGNNQSPMYGTYAAKAFLRSNVAPLTYIRLLGQQSVNRADTVAAKAGWQTTNLPSTTDTGGGAYGLFVALSSSITTNGAGATGKAQETGSFHLGAVIYSDGGAPLLSGTIHGGLSNKVTSSLGTFIDSDSNGNFKIGFHEGGTVTATDSFSVNFNDASQDFIRKRINTNPTLLDSGDFYPASAEKNYWLGETYEQFLRDNGCESGALVGVMLPLASGSGYDSGPSRMKGVPSQEAKAGWFIAQDTGPAGAFEPYNAQKLFRLKGRGHGEWLNKNAKVQIDRIRGPASLDEEYGSFSVIIRSLNDTDAAPQILERYDNCNLDPTSPNFISKKIGDVYYAWDEGNQRLRRYGNYENVSRYVYVELNDDVEAGATNPAFVPFGFFGPASYLDVAMSSSNKHDEGERSGGRRGIIAAACGATIYGGVSSSAQALTGGHDGRMLANFKFPSVPLVVNATDAGLTNITDTVFGMRTTRAATSQIAAHGIGDMHRMLAGGQVDDPTVTVDPLHNGGFNGFGYVFSMDDIISGSLATGGTGQFTYTSGSRKAGTSLTATASNDYRTLLDFGIDSFAAPFFGGFDGLDITKPDPLANSQIGASKQASYTHATIRQALETVADPELLDFNILAVPGLTNTALTNYQMEVCQERRDALAVVDLPDVYTPFAESYVSDKTQRANRNVLGTVQALRARRLDNSYACTFYPWVQTRDARTGQTLWIPPSVAMMGVLGSSQAKSDVWFAPAGFNRGGLSDGAAGIPILNASSRLSSKERDMLYDVNINPIASFPSTGIVVFGQKTLQARKSALDRINVRRLVIFLKKQISVLSTQVLFEQNVQATWDRFKGLIEPFLANVKTRYGLTEYKLVLDETTTTPDLIDQNILYAKIMIKPARAIEFIAIDFIIANTGASFDD